MASILSIRSEQPYRATIGLSAAPSTTASDYTLTRQDGGACAITCTLAWIPAGSPSVAELALSGRLLEGVVYVMAVSGSGSAEVTYRAPRSAPATGPAADDPEAEAFGVDRAWITDQLGPNGDLQRRGGLAAFKYDLGAIAATEPGELFHLPDDGAGMPSRVNGPGTPGEVAGVAASLKRQWSRDYRVKRGGVKVTPTLDPATGLLSADCAVETVAINKPVALKVTGA